jgi:putative Mg2+ transporter-C (MgtC) family protein
VRGLTTAAIVWMTAAVGMACGSGLIVLALVVTGGHFVVVVGFTVLEEQLPGLRGNDIALRVSYVNGRDVLTHVLTECERRRVVVLRVETNRASGDGLPQAILHVRGRGALGDLVFALDRLDGVLAVTGGNLDEME